MRARAGIAALLVLSLAVPAAAAQSGARESSGAQEGVASWYGPGFHGKRTASGEIYDEEGLTAAHKTLPFGSYLRVRSLDNGSSVVVRINDRGPFARGRVLDLSEAAARMIGMIPSGTARVSFEVIPEDEALAWRGGSPDGSPARAAPQEPIAPRVETAARVRIQVASYASEANAQATVRRLGLSGIDAAIEKAGSVNRVVISDLSVEASREVARRLDALGYRGYIVITVQP